MTWAKLWKIAYVAIPGSGCTTQHLQAPCYWHRVFFNHSTVPKPPELKPISPVPGYYHLTAVSSQSAQAQYQYHQSLGFSLATATSQPPDGPAQLASSQITTVCLATDHSVDQLSYSAILRILTDFVCQRHLNATTFKYHKRSQIIEGTVKPSFLFEKLISKHACQWSRTKSPNH